MTPAEIAAAPRHPQLFDPCEDPEELIDRPVPYTGWLEWDWISALLKSSPEEL